LLKAENEKKKTINLQKSKNPVIVSSDSSKKSPLVISDSLKNQLKKSWWGDFLPAADGKEEEVIIENEKLKVFISTKSGRVTNVLLKEFKRADKTTPIELFEKKTSSQEVILNCYSGNKFVSLDSMYFTSDKNQVTVSGDKSGEVKLKLQTARPGAYIEYVYSLKGNDYMLDYKMNFVNMDSIINQGSQVMFNIAMLYPTQEKHIDKERQIASVYYQNKEGKVDNLSLTALDSATDIVSQIKWVAFKQQFFTAAVIHDDAFEDRPKFWVKPFGQNENSISNLDMNYVKAAKANLFLSDPTAKKTHSLKYYFGPNHYLTMKEYDLDLEDMIPMGWSVFSYINKWLVVPVFHLFHGTDFGFGWVILILTLVIKGLLFPIGYMTFKSSARMKALKPETDKIAEKYGKDGDPLKKQQETMALYGRAGVSPFSGCLPLIFQMFVLIALFNYFPAAFELRQEPFWWADDLSTYDSIADFGFNIPLYGNHVSLFALMMFLSTIGFTYYQQKMFPNQQTGMPGMKFMMYAMPFLFLGFMNSYSAGLSWYYFVANVINILQNVLLRFFIKEEVLRAEVEKNLKNPQKAKKGFTARLEEMAKQRQKQVGGKR
ncbi:MAG: membrane protein insertase YidC, partial [Bacteroidota bacterium]